MTHLNSKTSVVGIFFVATALLVVYLLSIRWHLYFPVAIFWVSVTLMLGTIIYQSFKTELSPSYANIVLLEIAVTCLVFHLIYQIPYYGLRGYDAYVDMASAKGILSSGFVIGDPQYITAVSYFPIIHIFGTISSLITGIDLLSIAKWFPSLLDVALIPLLYLLVLSIFKGKTVALLSVLLFACLQHHILFSSLFIRETIALVLATCCVYLYFLAKHSPYPSTNYALSVMCLLETVFAHHLTSFMLLTFLLIHLLVTKAFEVPFLRVHFEDEITGQKVASTFLSIIFVALFAYWIHLVIFPLQTLVTFFRNVFNPSQWGIRAYAEIAGISVASLQTIRHHLIFYGFFFFHLIFGSILLYGLLPKAKNRYVETYSSTLFFFLCGLTGFLCLYLVAAAAFPDRFLMFGWLFGSAPLVATILKGEWRWPKKVSVFLLVTFMLFNIYMIDPTAWDTRAEGIPIATSEEDYALANTFSFSNGKIFGHQNPLMAIYDTHNNLGTVFALYDEVDPTRFEWVVIQKKELESERRYYPEPRTETIAALENLATKCYTDYDKIYESNSLLAFKRR